MSLEQQLTSELKDAMRAKDQLRLEALRAIKSAILLVKTQSGAEETLTEAQEIQLLQKLVKQRRDSAAIFKEQNRSDLAQPEEDQAAIIAAFLPQQLSVAEVETIVEKIIAETGASSMKDMGRVMGAANQQMAGQADGKTISSIVKNKLS
ncbi:MAG: GatB/YqeY domain-containing protein [Flavobacteriaceae bacterium]